jgi:hypothetical protein
MSAQFHPADLPSFSETDRSPLSIRARALVLIDPLRGAAASGARRHIQAHKV